MSPAELYPPICKDRDLQFVAKDAANGLVRWLSTGNEPRDLSSFVTWSPLSIRRELTPASYHVCPSTCMPTLIQEE